MYIEGNDSFVNIKDVMTITIDKNNPRIIVFTYLNNGGTVNLLNESEEVAKKNLKYFSSKAALAQSNGSIFDKF